MEKYYVHTTLSARHRQILDKHKEQYVTHQKVIEQALDCLENSSKSPVSSADTARQAMLNDKAGALRLTMREIMKVLIETADIDRFYTFVAEQKPAETTIEYYCQKPLDECSLKEVMDATVFISRYMYWFDKVMYEDEGDDRYTVKIYHSMGLNNSRMFQVFYGSLFKACGARAEIKITDGSLFIKVNKNI